MSDKKQADKKAPVTNKKVGLANESSVANRASIVKPPPRPKDKSK